MSERPLQSALHPASGSGAALLDELGTILYIGAGLIFTAVMVLALMGVFMRERNVNVRRWVIGGGLIFPAVTLTALLIYSVAVGNALASIDVSRSFRLFLTSSALEDRGVAPGSDAVRVHVVGKQWWWEVRYEVPGSSTAVVLANELHIPVDRPVLISLSSTDVIHSFWAPSLAGKVDMIPGRTTQLRIQTSEPGLYRGQCAEYCGGQHALMAFYIVAEPQADFDAWLKRQQQLVTVPTDPVLKLGYDAFFKGECHECHRVRGTPAVANEGPDLTHVGSRKSLAAGVLDNHIGTMAGWIAGAQDVKPGNPMPSDPVYTGRELRAVAAWLESLK
jgi:cytochrome c oxidase subunit II